MPRTPTRRRPSVVLAALCVAAALAAGCSHTGLSGTVPTTAEKNTDQSSGPDTATTAPDSTGTTGGGSTTPSDAAEGFIVYENLDTPASFWRINADGTQKAQLPKVPGQVLLSSPQLSPDATQLAFLATAAIPPVAPPTPGAPTTLAPPAPKPRLWISKADGTEPHALSPDGVAQTCFAWSPDNTRILSVGTDPATNAVISWLYPSDPSQPAAPSHLGLTAPSCPVYLGDNTVVIVGPAPGEDKPRPDQLSTLQLDGTPGQAVATLPGCSIDTVRPSPNNTDIAFSAACDDPAKSGIYVVVGTGAPTLAVPGASGAFSWSPDGGWLAYRRADAADPRNTTEILIGRLGGAKTKRLVGPASQSPTWGALPGGGASASKA